MRTKAKRDFGAAIGANRNLRPRCNDMDGYLDDNGNNISGIDSNNDTSHIDDDTNPNLTRIGWSIADASINLGEEPLSFGFGGTGKASTRKNFRDYGRR